MINRRKFLAGMACVPCALVLPAMADEGSLKLPPMYMGRPVDLSNLDTPVNSYVTEGKLKKK